MGKQEILSTLKPFWKQIQAERQMITLWRNEIVAHSASRAKDSKLFNEIDPNYHENIEKILIISRYSVIYLWALIVNLFSEYDDVWNKKDQKTLNNEKWEINELLTNIIHKEKIFFQKVNSSMEIKKSHKTIFCGYDKWPMNKVD